MERDMVEWGMAKRDTAEWDMAISFTNANPARNKDGTGLRCAMRHEKFRPDGSIIPTDIDDLDKIHP